MSTLPAPRRMEIKSSRVIPGNLIPDRRMMVRAAKKTMTKKMPVITIQARLSPNDLLQAVKQLAPYEFTKFASEVMALQRQRNSFSQVEADLLKKINQGLPTDQEARFSELISKRMADALTSDEHDELLRITEQVEAMNVERITHLAKLAQLRQTSLNRLMTDLGIGSPDVL